MKRTMSDPVPPAGSAGTAGRGGYDRRVLNALRRLSRAVDVYSRRLIAQHQVTGPQLVCVGVLAEQGPVTATGLARAVHLSPSTVVRILDRLEAKGLVTRQRSTADRRRVQITLTDRGREVSQVTPYSDQHPLRRALESLPPGQQARIAEDLERLVALLDAEAPAPTPLPGIGGLDLPLTEEST